MLLLNIGNFDYIHLNGNVYLKTHPYGNLCLYIVHNITKLI